jgi:quercetin dioxygenase-like cupin family protein
VHAETVPNANIGRHSHPGDESGYVLQGDIMLRVDGQRPKPLKVGDRSPISRC